MEKYADFITSKAKLSEVGPIMPFKGEVHGPLYDFQRHIVNWALAKRRAGIFAATGLGKSFSLLAYADAVLRHVPGSSVLILTPLCTAKQLIGETTRMFPELPIQ